MDSEALISGVRDHYIQQFNAFVAFQVAKHSGGVAEVMFELPENDQLFRRLYCVDFAVNKDGLTVIEMEPDRLLSFEPIRFVRAQAKVSIESLCWDDIIFKWGGCFVWTTAWSSWFEKWFDPDDRRTGKADEALGRIHSLSVEGNSAVVDFGTARPKAFWEFLDHLIASGVQEVRVSTSRTVESAS